MWHQPVTSHIFKGHQWRLQVISSCYRVSGWHFQTTTIYILSHFWESGIWHGNVTISITESQCISLDSQEVRDALQGNCTSEEKEGLSLMATHHPSSSFYVLLLPISLLESAVLSCSLLAFESKLLLLIHCSICSIFSSLPLLPLKMGQMCFQMEMQPLRWNWPRASSM